MIIKGKIIENWVDAKGNKGSRIMYSDIRYTTKEYQSIQYLEIDDVLPLGEEVIIHMDIRVSPKEELPI